MSTLRKFLGWDFMSSHHLACSLAYAAYAAALGALYAAIDHIVPEPYMDEPFHLRQTQAYCAGRWSEWDEKITTFPGLYLLGTASARLLAAAGLSGACDLAALRAINMVPALATPWLVHSLLQALHPSAAFIDRIGHTAVLSLMPTHFFYHTLFYTDSAATCSVLLLLLLTLPDRPEPGHRTKFARRLLRHTARAGAASLAISLRQTNAVWVAFIVASSSLRELQRTGTLTASAPLSTALAELPQAGSHCLLYLMTNHGPSLALLGAFAAFVVHNGAVVVGDRANHAPSFHGAQLLYLTGYAAAPFALDELSVRLRGTLTAASRAVADAPCMSGVALSAVLLLAHATLPHPFLLADNRHVTFYLWRHVLGRHWLVRYALAPAHLLFGYLVYPGVWHTQGALVTLGLLLCSALVLIPSPLLELRYLTLPAILLRLHAPLTPGWRGWLPTLAVFAALDMAMAALFLLRPYAWVDGTVARFMW